MNRLIPLLLLGLSGCDLAASRCVEAHDFEHVEVEPIGTVSWEFVAVKEGKSCEGTAYTVAGAGIVKWECGGQVMPNCTPGDPASCERLARRLWQTDRSSALEAIVKTCEYGGSCVLAEPDELDPALYQRLAARGCDRGAARSCAAMGALLYKRDERAAALQFAERACQLHSGWGCRLQVLATGPTMEWTRAKVLLTRACGYGDERSCDALRNDREPANKG